MEQYRMLCVSGGIEPGLRLSNETWGCRPQPIEATRYIGWKRVGDLPNPTAGASAAALGQASVNLGGGFQGAAVSALPPVDIPTRKDDRPWLYHTVTDA
jgi:hypothetical protein